MYNLPYFKDHDPAVLVAFMKQHPFAMLIAVAEGKAHATQIPLLIEEQEGQLYLVGHMMRKQDHHIAFEKNLEALVIFTGPSAYVSATWYTDPHQASTINYMCVHARGTLRFLNQEGLEDALRKLSLHFENNNREATTVFDNLPSSYRTELMKAIVAFEIKITNLEHVSKLSQNRDLESFDQITTQLQQQGGDAAAVADAMRERKNKLFPS